MTKYPPGGMLDTLLGIARAQESLRPNEVSLLGRVVVSDEQANFDRGYLERRRVSREAVESIRPVLDRTLGDLNAVGRKDREAFNRYCNALRQCFESHPNASDLTNQDRCYLMGLYFEAGMKGKRKAGRPGRQLEWLFVHIWHTINLELQQEGKPMLTGKIPAQAIAARCALDGYGNYSTRNVSDALRPDRRSITECPYYAKIP